MADILKSIEEYKRREIAAAKRARPYAEIEAAAKAAPRVRNFRGAIEDLIAANPGIEDRGLQAGDVINLPIAPGDVPTPAPATATPEAAEPTPAEDAAASPTSSATQPTTGQIYIVQSGDIPVTIAEQFGITVEALLAANPGIDARGLQVGQSLVIPPPIAGVRFGTAGRGGSPVVAHFVKVTSTGP